MPRCASGLVAESRDPESFAHNPAWTANYRATKDLPHASSDDIVWADAVIFGSPTRFGSVASQLRDYLDSLGGLWAEGQARRQGVRRVHLDATPRTAARRRPFSLCTSR